MYFLICPQCGKEFNTDNKRQKFCCKKCAKTYHNKKRYIIYNKICPICGKEFETKQSKTIYCSKKCLYKSNNKKRNDNNKKIYNKKCAICNNEFIAHTKLAKYCSEECRIEGRKKLIKKYIVKNKNNKEYTKRRRDSAIKWKKNNKEHLKEYSKKNREKMNARRRFRDKNDIDYHLKQRLRTSIGNSLRKYKKIKTFKTFNLLDYTVNDLKLHLESLFQEGMNWSNHSHYGWHIDHIKPVSSFNFVNSDGSINLEEIKKCWALDNLRPLWWNENLSKGAWYNNKCYKKGDI